MRTIQKAKSFIYAQSLRAGAIALALSYPISAYAVSDTLRVSEHDLGFVIPSFADILTFLIRAFFVAAGIAALIFLLLGAFSWVTSGGNKENVEKAREKIQAAVVGVFLIIIVVALVATLEQVVFHQALCFGLTCDLKFPELLKPAP